MNIKLDNSMTKIINSFHERIKAERIRLDLSQVELAERIGITRQTQALYERGKRYPDAQYLMLFCGIGANINYLLSGVPSSSPQIIEKASEPAISSLPYEALPATPITENAHVALALFTLIDMDVAEVFPGMPRYQKALLNYRENILAKAKAAGIGGAL